MLTPLESEELFLVMHRIAGEGTAVVFISHKIREVIDVATRVVVMRSGKVVLGGADAPVRPRGESRAEARPDGRGHPPALFESTAEELATAMVGVPRVDFAPEVRTRTGEIVAIVGVAGNGQRELADAMLREHPRSRVGFIPEDRTRDGLVAEMTIAENVALTAEDWRAAVRRTPELIEQYSIRAQGPSQLAGSLSGGNQQKVILARELDRRPERIIAAEPTRGLEPASVHEHGLRTPTHRSSHGCRLKFFWITSIMRWVPASTPIPSMIQPACFIRASRS